MDEKERLANSVAMKGLLEIDGVTDVIDPIELNQQIVVMDNGDRYRLIVIEDNDIDQTFDIEPLYNAITGKLKSQ